MNDFKQLRELGTDVHRIEKCVIGGRLIIELNTGYEVTYKALQWLAIYFGTEDLIVAAEIDSGSTDTGAWSKTTITVYNATRNL